MSTTRPCAPDGRDQHADRGGPAPGRTGYPVRRLALTDASGAVPLARDFTRQALHDWGWLPALTPDHRASAEDILLVVSELVTNACLHGGGPEELRLCRAQKLLRLEVLDGGPGEPAPRTPHRAGRPGGHGMFIVQRLCLDWGVVRCPEDLAYPGPRGGPADASAPVGQVRPRKTVWAELAWPG